MWGKDHWEYMYDMQVPQVTLDDLLSFEEPDTYSYL